MKIVAAVLMVLMFGCKSSSCSKFIGTWTGEWNNKVVITENGNDNYILVFKESGERERSFPASCQNGQLNIGLLFVSIDESTHELLLEGRRYKKSN